MKKYNTKEKDDNFEKALDTAIVLMKRGESLPEIISRFPEYKEELRPLLEIAQDLSKEVQGLSPQESFAPRMRAALNETITREKQDHSLDRGYGRTSNPTFLTGIQTAMKSLKYVIPIGAVAVLVLVFAIGQSAKNSKLAMEVDQVMNETGELERVADELGDYARTDTLTDEEVGKTISPDGELMTEPASGGTPAPALLSEKSAQQAEERELDEEFNDMDGYFAKEDSVDDAASEEF